MWFENQLGGIRVDDASMATRFKGSTLGGDAITAAKKSINAMGAGKTKAKEMVAYLKALACPIIR